MLLVWRWMPWLRTLRWWERPERAVLQRRRWRKLGLPSAAKGGGALERRFRRALLLMVVVLRLLFCQPTSDRGRRSSTPSGSVWIFVILHTLDTDLFLSLGPPQDPSPRAHRLPAAAMQRCGDLTCRFWASCARFRSHCRFRQSDLAVGQYMENRKTRLWTLAFRPSRPVRNEAILRVRCDFAEWLALTRRVGIFPRPNFPVAFEESLAILNWMPRR